MLVIVGDVHPSQTLNSVRRMFGSIPSHAVPVRPAVQLRSFSPETINIDNSLGYGLCFIAYRLPGTDSPEYAATQILVDVLASQRGKVAEMVSAGLLGDAQFELVESYPKASIGLASMSLPAEASPADAVAAVRLVLSNYALAGVPADLVDAAKRHEAAAANFQRTSIPDLARAWSHALGGEGRMSLSADIDALQQVTTADVDRIASKYLLNANSMTAIARPVASSIAPATERFHKGEKTASVPAKSVRLPDWANRGLDHFERPDTFVSVSDSFLANGLRLIVRTDRSSPTVLLLGSVKHGPNSRDMAGREGLSDLLEALYPYGTETMDRLTFQKSLGDITAEESAGYTFSLSVPKEHFSRGVELLADNELHPALTKHSFGVTKRETTEFVAGRARSPSYLTGRALKRALLPAGDPLLREVTPVTLSRLTLDQVRQYHSATIRPDLTTIVIIGDLSQGDAKAVVERWFGAWQGVGPRPDPSLPSVPQNKPSARDILDVDGTQDFVVLTQQLELNRLDRDYYPLKLGTSVLGGGFYATRLYNDLRKETGYVYSVDVSLNASTTRASYSVSYACNPRNVAKTRSIIERDVNQMRAESISEGELHQAKALLTRQAVLGESSEESLAQGLLDRAELGLPLDEPILAAKRYAELDAEDVRKAFAKTIHTSRFAQIVQGPAHN